MCTYIKKFSICRHIVLTAVVNFRICGPKMAWDEQVCVHQVIQEVHFQNIFGAVVHWTDCSCAPIWHFFLLHQMAPQHRDRITFLGQFWTSLRKDSIANYASTWTLFSPLHSSVGRWRQKIRKFEMEFFQNVNNRMQTLCQILRMITIQILINSTHGAQHFALHPAGIALPLRWCFWLCLVANCSHCISEGWVVCKIFIISLKLMANAVVAVACFAIATFCGWTQTFKCCTIVFLFGYVCCGSFYALFLHLINVHFGWTHVQGWWRISALRCSIWRTSTTSSGWCPPSTCMDAW